ncbi:hypothetical protein Taro_037098, partial [Colocasia esculenta]|nr:hypothetical protein [Colocasia esculenta]
MEGAVATATAAARARAPIPLPAPRSRRCFVGWGSRLPMGDALKPSRKPRGSGFVRAQQPEYKDRYATGSHFDDSLANSIEVMQWESGYSFDDIAASQGIRIRRRPPPHPLQHNKVSSESCFENEENAPRNILEKIIWTKGVEVEQLKQKAPLAELKRYIDDAPPARDFVGALRASFMRTGMPALIAEVKKASPSRGVLQENFDPIHIAKAYEAGGAACISVLTDEKFFQGSFEYLEAIRNGGVKCPLLCKEFVIDAWQIYYGRCKGADAILLIAAVLTDLDIKYMTKICRTLGLAALIEVHDERELDRVLAIEGVQLVGINNRNLGLAMAALAHTPGVVFGPLVVQDHIRNGYLTTPTRFGAFPPVVESPYFLGVIPAVVPTATKAQETSKTTEEPQAQEADLVQMFTTYAINFTNTPTTKKHRKHKHDKKPTTRGISSSGKTVRIGELRIRLDGSETMVIPERHVATIPKKRRTVKITEEGVQVYTCYASNINLLAITDQVETSNTEQHPSTVGRRREQARAWLDRVNTEGDLPIPNEGGAGVTDMTTTSNHPSDQ